MLYRFALLAGIIIGLLGCLGGGGGGGGTPAAPVTLELSVARIAGAGLDAVEVTATVTGTASPPALTVDRGAISSPTSSGGDWVATVTPTTTGEYTITATLGTLSETVTALVLQDVGANWGQPQAVPGLVNSEGYEDGVTVTPDGEYLFIQYGPWRWSSLLVFDLPRSSGGCGGDRLSPSRCEHPWINTTIGPFAGPERPGFPSGRYLGITQLHNAASWGVGIDGAPNYAVSTAFFGFRRQTDGSYRDPFVLTFDDLDDGLINPYGLSFQPLGGSNYRTTFTLQDTATTDARFDLYTYDLAAGSAANLGTYQATTPGNPPARSTPFASTFVDLGDNTGTQGNNHLELDASGDVIAIWTDDEYDSDADTHKISTRVIQSGTFPTTTDYTAVVLPDIVNVPTTEAIQPYMTDDGLYFTQDTSIAFAGYSGSRDAAGYGTTGNWSAPVVQLQKDTTLASLYVTTSDLGKIIAMGEPSLAEIDGQTVMFFVYAAVRGIDPITGLADLDFQAGYVPAVVPLAATKVAN